MTRQRWTRWPALFLLAGALVTRASAQVTLQPPVKSQLSVQLGVPQNAIVGDTVTLQIAVGNQSTTPLSNATLHVELSEGLKHAQGRIIEAALPALAAGENKRISLTTTAAEPGLQTASVLVTAGGTEATARASVRVAKPILELRLDAPEHRFLGRVAEFDLDIVNNGTETARNVDLIAELPEGLEFAEASDRGVFNASTRQVRWNLGSLAAQHHRGLTLRLRQQAVGEATVRATARAERLPETSAEVTVRGDAVPCMVMEVRDIDDSLAVGAETSYEIRVVNLGTCQAVRIQVFALVPDGLTLLDATGPTKAQLEGQQVIYTPLPRLAPGAEVIYRVQIRGTRPGDWRFRVQMFSDQLRIPLVEEEVTRVHGDGP